MELRDYQLESINGIRSAYNNGYRRVLLHLPTGSGKTVIFCHLLKSLAKNGKRALMVVRGRMLVENGHRRLMRENVPHGVAMAGHWNYWPDMPVQCCSIDTLRARGLTPQADFIVIDEAHYATSNSYHWLIEQYPSARILGVTATPYCKKSMEHIAQTVVAPIDMDELVDRGFLVPMRYFAPYSPDLSGVKIQNGEYHKGQLNEAMDKPSITADLVTTYKRYGENRPAICFAVSLEHSRAIRDAFNNAGIAARHIEAHSTDDERNKAISDLHNGSLRIITNVGILTTGVDMPHVSCIIMARPTRSLNLHIQMIGRGTRIDNGKADCLLLDHANNTALHGFINAEHDINLSGQSKKKKDPPQIKICKYCFACYTGSYCKECGHQAPPKPREIVEVDGELVEIDKDIVTTEYEKLQKEQKSKGYKRAWIYYRLKDKFGEACASRLMPKREVPSWIANKITKASDL